MFVALGASASVIGSLIRVYSGPLATVAGIVIIIMGLHFLGVTPIALLHRQKRLEVAKPVGLWGAYVIGLAFAFGWTPCIGPILAAILAVAASEQTVTQGREPARGLFARASAFLSLSRPSRSSRSRPSLSRFRIIFTASSRRWARCWS